MQINSLQIERKPIPGSNMPSIRNGGRLSKWLRFARAGDVVRAVFAPHKIIQAADNALPHDELIFLEGLLNGGDLAIVQSYFGKLVLMDEATFASITEGNQ